MRVLAIALILGCLVALFACRRRTDAVSFPEITSGGEEGFHDLVLALTSR
jgi:hypothetical protein